MQFPLLTPMAPSLIPFLSTVGDGVLNLNELLLVSLVTARIDPPEGCGVTGDTGDAYLRCRARADPSTMRPRLPVSTGVPESARTGGSSPGECVVHGAQRRCGTTSGLLMTVTAPTGVPGPAGLVVVACEFCPVVNDVVLPPVIDVVDIIAVDDVPATGPVVVVPPRRPCWRGDEGED